MTFSNVRKKAISGWLLMEGSSNEAVIGSSLKLQKYLFFYEMMSIVKNDPYDLTKLRGYENGPVFSDVYGDYTYERNSFIKESIDAYKNNPEIVNDITALSASFLTQIMTEKELSTLTHEFNIWKAKEDEIKRRHLDNVSLSESDFSQNDKKLINELMEIYSTEFINNSLVIELGKKIFIMQKDDLPRLRLKPDKKDIFLSLSEQEDLVNPIYVTVDDEGVILID